MDTLTPTPTPITKKQIRALQDISHQLNKHRRMVLTHTHKLIDSPEELELMAKRDDELIRLYWETVTNFV